MTPSPEHELGKEVLSGFIETLAEETDLSIYPIGSTIFQRPKLKSYCYLSFLQLLMLWMAWKHLVLMVDTP